MTAAYCFVAISVVFTVVFLFLSDLFIFRCKRMNAFKKRKDQPSYLLELEREHKEKKHPMKKNFLLFLIVLTYQAQGKFEQAESLVPFVKESGLLGIKKSSVR